MIGQQFCTTEFVSETKEFTVAIKISLYIITRKGDDDISKLAITTFMRLLKRQMSSSTNNSYRFKSEMIHN